MQPTNAIVSANGENAKIRSVKVDNLLIAPPLFAVEA